MFDGITPKLAVAALLLGQKQCSITPKLAVAALLLAQKSHAKFYERLP